MSDPLYEALKRDMRRREDEAYLNETTRAEIVSDLRAMGVENKFVMVHSSFKLLRPLEGGPAGVVNALIEAVGPRGLLLIPTFNFTAFSEQGYFDKALTPSAMGVITQHALENPHFIRTPHPMLNFAMKPRWVTPEYQYSMDLASAAFMADAPNAHGAGSIFDRFIQNDGLLISIGADQQTGFKDGDVGFTASVHAFVEAGVDWRYMKVFEGVYVDGGVASIRKYAASVTRDPKRFQTAVTAGHLEGERLGVIKRMKLGRTECWVAEAKKFHEFAVESCIKRPELWRHEI